MRLLLLALLLTDCAGWPKERTVWIPDGPTPPGLVRMRVNPCCGSMRPSFKGGEVIFAEPYRGQPVVPGDIVDTVKVMHRVLAVNSRAVYLSGDAQRRSDGWVPKKDIRFIIRYVIRPSSTRFIPGNYAVADGKTMKPL